MYKGNSFGFVDRIVKKLVGMKIGILYIGIGKYLSLWDDFYLQIAMIFSLNLL